MTAEFATVLAMIAAIFPCALSLYLIITASLQVLWRESSAPISARAEFSVTVLVPAHNEELTLAGCLDALVASTHPALTIFVVSDGSTDGTATIARRYSARGVRLLEMSENLGKSGALDAALAEVRSDLVLVIDADTQVAPDAVGRLAAACTDPKTLWHESGTSGESVSAFASASIAGARDRHEDWRISSGVHWRGLLPQRDDDVTDVAIIHEKLGDQTESRTAWELLHRVPLSAEAWLQFTVQQQNAGDWRIGFTLGWDP